MDKDMRRVCISELKFEDHGLLGQGGFGVVRLAVSRGGKQVAVKQLPVDALDDARREFENEAQHMHRVEHKNILDVDGILTDVNSQTIGIVLPYLPKRSLKLYMHSLKNTMVHQIGDLNWWILKVRWLRGIVKGMQCLHSLKPILLHLDLKPENVLISEDLHAKVSDFGMARSKWKYCYTSDGTTSASLGGTIKYIPPEYLENPKRAASTKFDVYSFGITLYFILKEDTAYKDLNLSLLEFEKYVLAGNRPDITSIYRPHGLQLLVDELADLAVKCWQQDPTKRLEFDDIRQICSRIYHSLETTRIKEMLSRVETNFQNSEGYLDEERQYSVETLPTSTNVEYTENDVEDTCTDGGKYTVDSYISGASNVSQDFTVHTASTSQNQPVVEEHQSGPVHDQVTGGATAIGDTATLQLEGRAARVCTTEKAATPFVQRSHDGASHMHDEDMQYTGFFQRVMATRTPTADELKQNRNSRDSLAPPDVWVAEQEHIDTREEEAQHEWTNSEGRQHSVESEQSISYDEDPDASAKHQDSSRNTMPLASSHQHCSVTAMVQKAGTLRSREDGQYLSFVTVEGHGHPNEETGEQAIQEPSKAQPAEEDSAEGSNSQKHSKIVTPKVSKGEYLDIHTLDVRWSDIWSADKVVLVQSEREIAGLVYIESVLFVTHTSDGHLYVYDVAGKKVGKVSLPLMSGPAVYGSLACIPTQRQTAIIKLYCIGRLLQSSGANILYILKVDVVGWTVSVKRKVRLDFIPQSITVDPTRHLVITGKFDKISDHIIVVYDREGDQVLSTQLTPDIVTCTMSGIKLPNGQFIVVDFNRGKLVWVTRDGRMMKSYPSLSLGSGKQQPLCSPTTLIMYKKTVIVGYKHAVMQLNEDGKFLRHILKQNEVINPHCMAIKGDTLCVGHHPERDGVKMKEVSIVHL